MEKIYSLKFTQEDLVVLGVAICNLRESYEQNLKFSRTVPDNEENAQYWLKSIEDVKKLDDRLLALTIE